MQKKALTALLPGIGVKLSPRRVHLPVDELYWGIWPGFKHGQAGSYEEKEGCPRVEKAREALAVKMECGSEPIWVEAASLYLIYSSGVSQARKQEQ